MYAEIAPTTDKDIEIINKYLFEGMYQIDIAKEYGMTQPAVSQLIRARLNDERIKSKLIQGWEKEYSFSARKKALELVKSIDVNKVPDSSKAMSSGILVDKARLIDGEATAHIAYADLSDSLKGLQQEEETLMAELSSDMTDLEDLSIDDLDREIREIEEG